MSSPDPAQERTPTNAELCVKAMEAMESPEAADAPASQESAEALGKAMQGLSVKQPASAKPAGPPAPTRVNAADVTFIMGEMEVSKQKATDALRACGGNVTEALLKFIYAS